MNALAAIAPTPTQHRSVLSDMATRYGMEPAAFEATVRATCSPGGQNARALTREEFAAFLLVAKEYNLNPITREVYAFPKKGGGIVPIVSVDGWISLVNSHGACDGIEFETENNDKGDPVSVTCRIYRKDRSRPVEVTEYLSECIRDTEPWKMKRRMLRHKSLIQCARYAFGFSGIYDEDEGEKIAQMRDITPATATASMPKPPAPPKPNAAPALPAPEPQADAQSALDKLSNPEVREMVTNSPSAPPHVAKAPPKPPVPSHAPAPDQGRPVRDERAPKPPAGPPRPPAPPAGGSDTDMFDDFPGDKPMPDADVLTDLEGRFAMATTEEMLQRMWAFAEEDITALPMAQRQEAEALYDRHLARVQRR